jgi:hypothetical protein
MILEWTAADHGVETLDISSLKSLDWNALEEVYHIRHRSVYRARLLDREVAIKEVRHLRFRQRFRLGHGCRSKVALEFLQAQELYAREPITPQPLALGLDQNFLGLKRVFQVYQWLPEARSLTDLVRAGERPWEELVPFLWKCASLGLVHGGHSSENLMRSKGKWWVIDLAEANIHEALYQPGFVRDVARIARKLIREQAADDAVIESFVSAVADHPGSVSISTAEILAAMDKLVEEADSRRKG